MKNSKIFVVLFAFVLLFTQQAAAYDNNKLNLSVSVAEEYIYIGVRGGFQPNVYYRVLEGEYSNRYAVINKESVDDPGRVIWAVYSSKEGNPDSVYVDKNNRFLAYLGEGHLGMRPPENLIMPRPGTVLATISPNSARELSLRETQRSVVAPLSAFDVIAKDLIHIHTQFIDLEDVDYAFLSIDDNFFGNNRLRELRPLMSALKNAGFRNVCFGSLNDDEGFRNRAYKEAYKELYSPFNLEPSNKCVAMKTRGVLNLLTAQTKNASTGVSESKKKQKFTKDIDEVLKDVASLKAKGNTANNHCRDADGNFNEGYAEGGHGDGLASLLGGGGGIATKVNGSVRIPAESDIDVAGNSRSPADIAKVIRQRAPGLRHIYNKFLKKKPRFLGKVTLRLMIAPDGEIVSISVISSTTGYSEFDCEIKDAVSRWKFGKVRFGNTSVTIPFTFSE